MDKHKRVTGGGNIDTIKKVFASFIAEKTDKSLSSVQLEKALKSLGITMSRKSFNELRNAGLISGSTIDGHCRYARRYKYCEQDLESAVIYALTDNCSGIARGVPSKTKIIKFAKDLVDNSYKKDNIPVEAFASEAMTSAHLFIDSKTPLNKRIQISKHMRKLLLHVMITTKFVELWVHESDDVCELWRKVRKYLFDAKAIKRFSQKICKKTQDYSKAINLQDLTTKSLSNPKLRQALMAWAELIMVFPANVLLAAEMSSYFQSRFALQLDISADSLEMAALAIYTTV